MATFNIIVTLIYEIKKPSTLILNIEPLHLGQQVVVNEKFQLNREVEMKTLETQYPSKRNRILKVNEPGPLHITYRADVKTAMMAIAKEKLLDVSIDELPASVLTYLHPSRYCQSDKLYTFASNHFGNLQHPYEKVMAIRDWIYSYVEYQSGFSDAQTSALDTLIEQVGVCRDFSHIGVALCRALDIPARYLSAYAYQLDPPDFHACFEVYLGGYWVVIDATKLAPLNGLIRISSGLDATETAIASVFGQTELHDMEVSLTLPENEQFVPVDAEHSLVGYTML
ncbi:transglutaminase family protein [Olivibacter sp. SDN3]|uniref:transglutaminase-like domain-containing protein n=1 Tax=Olivibacter sp. SDN3 TaxID=2764720 RepID=UPI001651691C|nr:transglutaminase family protein [Olivibacter sp. SDN3]QNL48242.1 transglutaminase family protein [Olivibacter sp. SDN3]